MPSGSQDLFASSSVGSPFSPTFVEGLPRTPGQDVPIHIRLSPRQAEVIHAVEEQEHQQEKQQQQQEQQQHHQKPQESQEEHPHQQQQQEHHMEDEEEHLGSVTHSGTESTDDYSSPASSRSRSIITMPKKVEAELAEWLQEQEFLYVRTHADNKNKDKKERVLEEKGKSLSPPQSLEDMKKWLHTRRTQYGRMTKKLEKSGAARAQLTSHKKWILRTYHFLKRHIKRQRPTQSLGLPQVCNTFFFVFVSNSLAEFLNPLVLQKFMNIINMYRHFYIH